ncbi:hypothetical protein [Roseomonas sp. WA12]
MPRRLFTLVSGHKSDWREFTCYGVIWVETDDGRIAAHRLLSSNRGPKAEMPLSAISHFALTNIDVLEGPGLETISLAMATVGRGGSGVGPGAGYDDTRPVENRSFS